MTSYVKYHKFYENGGFKLFLSDVQGKICKNKQQFRQKC